MPFLLFLMFFGVWIERADKQVAEFYSLLTGMNCLLLCVRKQKSKNLTCSRSHRELEAGPAGPVSLPAR